MKSFDQTVVDQIIAGTVAMATCRTDDRDAAIRQLLTTGLSETQIALRLGGNIATIRKIVRDDAARAARPVIVPHQIGHLGPHGCITRRTMQAAR